MEFGTSKWRILKTLSNCAFVVMVFIQFLDWYNRDQIELVINDVTAKAYWLQIQHLYDQIGWVPLR